MMKNTRKLNKVFFVSLGCDKNLVDSEQMLGILNEKGFYLTDDEEDADIVVINSCCFILDAKEESIEAVIEAGKLKSEGKVKFIILTGCLAERYSDEIKKEMPEVDAVIGSAAFDEIAAVIGRLTEGYGLKENGIIIEKKSRDTLTNPDVRRSITTGGHYEYLKIAEGCDKNCSYCIIPSIRGKYRSIPMERLLRDAEYLAESGVKELILVAQETTLYGTDIYGRKALPELLQSLNKIGGIEWIRLLYCYPEEIDDVLIAAIKELPKVCHYLDIPVQHCSDRILRKMGRRTSKKDISALIERLKREIPDIAIRTTLISGFPGESEEEHEELISFIRDMGFDRLGVFAYSPEEGTKAALFDGQIADKEKERRRDALMRVQQEISKRKQESLVGQEINCIIEGRLPDENVYAARSYRDAPDVDGMVFIDADTGTEPFMTGDFVRVRIEDFSEYDLYGSVI